MAGKSLASLGLTGKKALVVGVANKHSLAFAIASTLQAHGCEVGVVSGPKSFDRAEKSLSLLPEMPAFHLSCDVTNPSSLNNLLKKTQSDFPVDCLVHSVAFAPSEALTKPFLQTSEMDFLLAMQVSAVSLLTLVQNVHINPHASIVALSYLGAEKAIPNYNCMGPAKAALEATCRQLAMELGSGEKKARVNVISAGPLNTLSARGIPGISKMRKLVEINSPLRRNVTPKEVADTTAFLLSNMASGITGQTIHGKFIQF